MFSKSYCPYCKATKQTLSDMGAKFYAIELDQVGMFAPDIICTDMSRTYKSDLDDGADIQNALEEMTHQRSVPNIFIQKKHIGGNSDLQSKKSELPSLLKEAGAV